MQTFAEVYSAVLAGRLFACGERLTKALGNALSLNGREGREGLGCRDTILLLWATAVEEVSVSADCCAVLGTLCGRKSGLTELRSWTDWYSWMERFLFC